MSVIDLARQHLGDSAARYLANKHRGGQNGRKGTIYEDWFAAFKLAQAFYDRVVLGDVGPRFFEAQAVGFVDDFVIYKPDATDFYQLKNVEGLSWGAGAHPLETDFSMQIELSVAQGHPLPTTNLVCSKQDLADVMSETMPQVIAGHSRVHHFEYDDSEATYRMLLSNASLRDAVSTISRDTTGDIASLGVTLDILLATWRSLGVGIHTIEDVIQGCRERQPAAFRLEESDAVLKAGLDPRFVRILDGIPNLSYDIVRGYFNYRVVAASGFEVSKGSPTYCCTSSDFRHFCGRVVAQSPTTVDDFEVLL